MQQSVPNQTSVLHLLSKFSVSSRYSSSDLTPSFTDLCPFTILIVFELKHLRMVITRHPRIGQSTTVIIRSFACRLRKHRGSGHPYSPSYSADRHRVPLCEVSRMITCLGVCPPPSTAIWTMRTHYLERLVPVKIQTPSNNTKRHRSIHLQTWLRLIESLNKHESLHYLRRCRPLGLFGLSYPRPKTGGSPIPSPDHLFRSRLWRFVQPFCPNRWIRILNRQPFERQQNSVSWRRYL